MYVMLVVVVLYCVLVDLLLLFPSIEPVILQLLGTVHLHKGMIYII